MPRLSEVGGVPLRQRIQKLVRTGLHCGAYRGRFGYALATVTNVVERCACDDYRRMLHYGNVAAQRAQVIIAQISAVKQNVTAVWIGKAAQQIGKCRLAAARVAAYHQLRTGRDANADIDEERRAALMPEAHPVEHNFTP